MKRIMLGAVIMVLITAVPALTRGDRDFTGAFRRSNAGGDHCGRSISLNRVRHNQYRIDWELVSGEHFVVELQGEPLGNTLNFRKGSYGYIYTLSEHGTTLTVALTTPTEQRICTFLRVGQYDPGR